METYEIFELITKLRQIYPKFKECGASDIIKFALQKQIPMESKCDADGWVCPKCGCKRKERFSHCVTCGQALNRMEINIDPPKKE